MGRVAYRTPPIGRHAGQVERRRRRSRLCDAACHSGAGRQRRQGAALLSCRLERDGLSGSRRLADLWAQQWASQCCLPAPGGARELGARGLGLEPSLLGALPRGAGKPRLTPGATGGAPCQRGRGFPGPSLPSVLHGTAGPTSVLCTRLPCSCTVPCCPTLLLCTRLHRAAGQAAALLPACSRVRGAHASR